MINYLLIIFLILGCAPASPQKNDLTWTKPDVEGHWKLIDTKIVDDVPFLNLKPIDLNSIPVASEDSPWDHYTEYDLVFGNDSMFQVHYPEQAFEPMQYFLDTGYLHLINHEVRHAYPAQVINDTLFLYQPILNEPGYFKETYARTNFNDSILNVMKKYGINYPELAGTWMLVREKDYDYGTFYELKFPHAIPDSIEFSREQMMYALEHEKIYSMKTDGKKRDYSFSYDDSYIYFTPGEWYKGEDPMIHFYRK